MTSSEVHALFERELFMRWWQTSTNITSVLILAGWSTDMQHGLIDLDFGFQIRGAASHRNTLPTNPLPTVHTHRCHQKINNDRLFAVE